MIFLRYLFTLLSMLSLATHVARTQRLVESAVHSSVEPVPLELSVDAAEPVVIDALRLGDRAFLPAGAVFRYVGAPYTEHANVGEVVVDKKRRTIVTGDSVRTANGNLYIEAEQIAALLRATVHVDWNELAVTITDDTLLPAARRRERAQRIRQYNTSLTMPDDWDGDDTVAPSRPGTFEIDYGVVLSGQPNQWEEPQYFATVGTPLFGGSLTTHVQTGARRSETVWFLTQDKHPIVRHLLIGDLPLLGPWGHRLLGVTLSNAPSTYSAVYDTLSISGVAPMGWEVDVERNGELIAGDSSVSSGRYAFQVSQSYGITQYTVVMYSPEGEVHRVPHIALVHDELIPVRRLYYALSAGRCSDRSCWYAADTQLRFAPLRRMTLIGAFSQDILSQDASSRDVFVRSKRDTLAIYEPALPESSRAPVKHEPSRWSSLSAVVQATHALSLVGTSESNSAPRFFVQYVPSMAASLQLTWHDSALSYSGYWNGQFHAANTTLAIAGTARSRASSIHHDIRLTPAISGRFGRFAPFVQRHQISYISNTANAARLWTGGGDLWFPVRSLHFLRMHVDGVGTSSRWSIEPDASIALPHNTRLDVQARWQAGDAHPTTTWSIGKTVSFAAIHSSVSTASGLSPTTTQYLSGAMHADPWSRHIAFSPYSQIANAPIVTTLR